MSKAAHAMAETATPGMREPYTMVDAANHAMAEAVPELVVPHMVGSKGAVR